MGPAEFVCGQAERIGTEVGEIDRNFAGSLNRIHMQSYTSVMGNRRGFFDRLDHARLIVREHHGEHRGAVGPNKTMKGLKINDTIAIDRQELLSVADRQHRGVFDRRRQDRPFADGERLIVRLGAAGSEDDRRGRCSDQRRDLLAGLGN